MSGGSNITTSEARIASMQISQSAQGVPVPLLWGLNRVPLNLLWMDDFATVEHRSSQQAGKGGGTTMTNVTYTYTASVLLGVAAGVCSGIKSLWRNKDKLTDTTKTLPAQQLLHTAVVPVGRVITVPSADIWASTVQVTYTGDSAIITDYTVAAGVYTLGSSVAEGAWVDISYTTSAQTETLTALQNAGLTWFASGELGQTGWGYLTTAHSAQALAYSGVCHLAASNWLLGAAAGLPTLTVEAAGRGAISSEVPDANPATVLDDLLTDPVWGAGLPADRFGGFDAYGQWCAAAGLWLSPAWAERKGVFEWVNQLAKITHSQPLWDVDRLTMVPLATASLTSATGSYTPAPEYAGPVYSITDDDLIEPVHYDRPAPTDRYNRVSITYKSRAIDYASAVETAEDAAHIDAHGVRELPDVIDAPEVADPTVAATVAELILREQLTGGAEYRLKLPISFDLLQPLDIIQIEDARINLAPRLVRISEITEGDGGQLEVLATDVLVTGAVTTARQGSGGFGYNTSPPDAVSVRAVMLPTAATGDVQQLAIGVTAGANWGGSDIWVSSTGSDYRRIASTAVRARLGTLASSIASASTEYQPAQTLDVFVTGAAQLGNVSQTDFDAHRSLMWVNGELLSYSDATLTAAGRYSLNPLRRGLYSTSASAYSSGAPWLRVDDSLALFDVATADLGTVMYIKVTSRNGLGTYVQGLEEVAPLVVTLTPNPSPPDVVTGLALTTAFVGTYFDVNWANAARAADYELQIIDTATSTLMRTIYTSAQTVRYTHGDAVDDGDAKRNYTVKLRGRNTVGDGPWATLAISNSAPAAVTGVAASGSGTSRTVTWTASTASDLAGYIARYSTSSGFDPAAGGGTEFYTGPSTSAVLSGLTVGTTYYVRVAAVDVWDSDISYLNWSLEISFTA